ncbi:MAG: helix-turn-helix transcriptional regulator [Planctomycetaceae bacterium]
MASRGLTTKSPGASIGKKFASTLTSEQRVLLAESRAAALKERPTLADQARQDAVQLAAVEVEIRQAFELLKAWRLMQKVSLTELAERTGIAKSNLSALENNPAPNVTLLTLVRYAKALGKELRISVGDATPATKPLRIRRAAAL